MILLDHLSRICCSVITGGFRRVLSGFNLTFHFSVKTVGGGSIRDDVARTSEYDGDEFFGGSSVPVSDFFFFVKFAFVRSGSEIG